MLARLLTLCLLCLSSVGCIEVEQSEGTATSVDVSGRAAKGIIGHAVVSVYALENGQRRFLAETLTGADGRFQVSVPPATAPVLFELTTAADGASTMACDVPSGCGAVAFGETGPAPADLLLSTVMMPASLGGETVALTPVTHLWTQWSQSLPGGMNQQSLAVTRSQFASLTGLPDDFLFHEVPDVLDAGEFQSASPGARLHALLAAGYGEIMAQAGLDYTALTDRFSGNLVGSAGQLPETGSASLDWLLRAAALVGSHLGTDAGAEMASSLAARAAALGTGLSLAGPSLPDVPAELDQAMLTLDDLDHYLGLAGIDGSGTFFATQRAAQLEWLYTPEMVGLLQYTARSAAAAVVASLLGDQMAESANPVDLSSLVGTGAAAWYDNVTKTLTISGTVDGQTLDIVLGITPASTLSDVNRLDYSVNGSISNAEMLGLLDGTLRIDTYQTDFIPVIVAAQAMLSGGTEEDAQAFLTALADLLPVFHARATIDGQGSLVSQADPENLRFSGALAAWGELDLPALRAGEDYLMAEIASGELISPAGDMLYALPGETPLRVDVGDVARMSTTFGFQAFGMPAMAFQGQGSLAGLEDINDSLASVLDNQATTGTLALDPLITTISSLELGLFSLDGEAELRIPADAKTYHFVLENNRLVASLPNRADSALSFVVTGLRGGYVYGPEGALLATVAFDWQRGGAVLHLVNGETRSYLLGPITDLVPQEVLDAFSQLLQSLLPQ